MLRRTLAFRLGWIAALLILPACSSDSLPAPSSKTLNDVPTLTLSNRPRLTARDMQDFLQTEPIEVKPGLLRWRLADGDMYTHYVTAPDGERDLTDAGAAARTGQ